MKKNNLILDISLGLVLGVVSWLYLIFVHFGQEFLFFHLFELLPIGIEQIMLIIVPIFAILITILVAKFNVLKDPKNNLRLYVLYALLVLFSGYSVGPEASLIVIITSVLYKRAKIFEIEKKNNIVVIVVLSVVLVGALIFDNIPGMKYRFDNYQITYREILLTPLIILIGLSLMAFIKYANQFIEQKIKKDNYYLPLLGAIIFLFIINLINIVYSIKYFENIYFDRLLFSGESGIKNLGIAFEYMEQKGNIYEKVGLIFAGSLKILMYLICFATMLRGGAYFPYIYGVFGIGLGLSLILNIDPSYTLILLAPSVIGIQNKKLIYLAVIIMPIYLGLSSIIPLFIVCLFYLKIGQKLNLFPTKIEH